MWTMAGGLGALVVLTGLTHRSTTLGLLVGTNAGPLVLIWGRSALLLGGN